MISIFVAASLFSLGLGLLAISYLPFSPITRDLVVFLSRDAQIRIFQMRYVLWLLAILSWLVLVVATAVGQAHWSWAAITLMFSVIFGLAFWATYVPVVMAPPKRQVLMGAMDADRLLDPGESVLGIVVHGAARAYPRRLIARPHWFNDEFDGKQLMISYCILCNSAQAFVPYINGKKLNLRNMTAYNNNTVYHDTETGNFIQQLEGRIIAGPDKGATLEAYPVVISSWKDWKSVHPDSTVLYAPPLTLRDRATQFMLDTMIPMERLASRSKPWHLIRGGQLDRRLPPMSLVFGISINGEACAFPMEVVRRNRVINDVVGGTPVVLLFSSSRDIGQIFVRSIRGRILQFEAADEDNDVAGMVARDHETSTVWDISGRALSGPLKGAELDSPPHYNRLFWFSWAIFYPNTRIYLGSEAAKVTPTAARVTDTSALPVNQTSGQVA